MGSHLPLGDRQACLPGGERANIRPSEIPVFDFEILWLTNKKRQALLVGACFFLFVLCTTSNPLALCVLNMGIAARDTISIDYTYSTDCPFHLLARQDTDLVGMRNIAPPLSLRLGHRTALVLLTPFTTVLPLRYRVRSLIMRSKFPCESLEYRKLYSIFSKRRFLRNLLFKFLFWGDIMQSQQNNRKGETKK